MLKEALAEETIFAMPVCAEMDTAHMEPFIIKVI
jgi:hypothetical protein